MRLRALVILFGCVPLFCAAQTETKPAPRGPNYAGQQAAKITADELIVYKTIEGQQLQLHVFKPRHATDSKPRPAFVAIHGGGWTSGAPRSMYGWTDWAAEHNMVAISVQYRLFKPKTAATVFKCVQDVRSALRYIRSHAAELGIDPNRIVVSGASAGGHLAVATTLFEFDEPGEETDIDPDANALVLFSPVIDTSTEGYGNAKIGERWEDLSPRHRVIAGLPPTILFHGTGDTTTPFLGAREFHEAMQRAGNRSELVAVEGAPHTYMFKDKGHYEATRQRVGEFLAKLGYIE